MRPPRPMPRRRLRGVDRSSELSVRCQGPRGGHGMRPSEKRFNVTPGHGRSTVLHARDATAAAPSVASSARSSRRSDGLSRGTRGPVGRDIRATFWTMDRRPRGLAALYLLSQRLSPLRYGSNSYHDRTAPLRACCGLEQNGGHPTRPRPNLTDSEPHTALPRLHLCSLTHRDSCAPPPLLDLSSPRDLDCERTRTPTPSASRSFRGPQIDDSAGAGADEVAPDEVAAAGFSSFLVSLSFVSPLLGLPVAGLGRSSMSSFCRALSGSGVEPTVARPYWFVGSSADAQWRDRR